MKQILITIIAVLSFSACQTSRQMGAGIYGWHNVAVTEDMEIYTDTLNLLVSKISNTITTDKQIHTYKKIRNWSKRLRDSILSPIFHSYIFAMYKNESLWI